jgi:hypothetical protein
MGLKAAMRQHAVDADFLAQLDERVQDCQQCQIGPGDGAMPEQVDSENHR